MEHHDIFGYIGFLVLWFSLAFFNGTVIYLYFSIGQGGFMFSLASLFAMLFLFGSLFFGKKRLRWFLYAAILSFVSTCVILLGGMAPATVQY